MLMMILTGYNKSSLRLGSISVTLVSLKKDLKACPKNQSKKKWGSLLFTMLSYATGKQQLC